MNTPILWTTFCPCIFCKAHAQVNLISNLQICWSILHFSAQRIFTSYIYDKRTSEKYIYTFCYINEDAINEAVQEFDLEGIY